jgi:hypothetical protein
MVELDLWASAFPAPTLTGAVQVVKLLETAITLASNVSRTYHPNRSKSVTWIGTLRSVRGKSNQNFHVVLTKVGQMDMKV